jgi:hypothetical protein
MWIKSPEFIQPFPEEKVFTPKFNTFDVELDDVSSSEEFINACVSNFKAGEFLDLVWMTVAFFPKLYSDLPAKIDAMLKPYNIRIEWAFDDKSTSEVRSKLKDYGCAFEDFGAVLNEVVDYREPLASLVLNGVFEWEHQLNDTTIEDTFGKRDGYLRFAVDTH